MHNVSYSSVNQLIIITIIVTSSNLEQSCYTGSVTLTTIYNNVHQTVSQTGWPACLLYVLYSHQLNNHHYHHHQVFVVQLLQYKGKVKNNSKTVQLSAALQSSQ